MADAVYKRVFLIGALWNVVGGSFILVATSWIFSTAGLGSPEPPLYYYSWIALFMTFGIGYYMVYRNMYANKNIVILGIIGKLAFAGVFIYGFLAFKGRVPFFFLIPLIGDLVFVLPFWMFLNFAKRAGR